MYINIECGNVLTYEEMIKEGAELYDLDDPTNFLMYSEYYYMDVCAVLNCDFREICPHAKGIHYDVWGEGIECKLSSDEIPYH